MYLIEHEISLRKWKRSLGKWLSWKIVFHVTMRSWVHIHRVHVKSQTAVYVCNPSTGEVETRESLWLVSWKNKMEGDLSRAGCWSLASVGIHACAPLDAWVYILIYRVTLTCSSLTAISKWVNTIKIFKSLVLYLVWGNTNHINNSNLHEYQAYMQCTYMYSSKGQNKITFFLFLSSSFVF